MGDIEVDTDHLESSILVHGDNFSYGKYNSYEIVPDPENPQEFQFRCVYPALRFVDQPNLCLHIARMKNGLIRHGMNKESADDNTKLFETDYYSKRIHHINPGKKQWLTSLLQSNNLELWNTTIVPQMDASYAAMEKSLKEFKLKIQSILKKDIFVDVTSSVAPHVNDNRNLFKQWQKKYHPLRTAPSASNSNHSYEEDSLKIDDAQSTGNNSEDSYDFDPLADLMKTKQKRRRVSESNSNVHEKVIPDEKLLELFQETEFLNHPHRNKLLDLQSKLKAILENQSDHSEKNSTRETPTKTTKSKNNGKNSSPNNKEKKKKKSPPKGKKTK